ncbi:DUF4031 domain-containing protein [Myxococcus sp. AS-1-15]|uniref:DUF4031 domain-containing protein n=1 Tax=Myxococcus sp. AS-1-15 TaxID=2874600 RepID=UPI001CBD3132|nr:DUF4031 domain-containing protein [Myxococcus sp. AS-1-15]MBZ4400388.1 DUF4031 domain-containing protein [Myxococcus sp. AS-1-15]
MTVYVDVFTDYGLAGKSAQVRRVFAGGSCHLFTDSLDLGELHALAARIGMRRSWFQVEGDLPHYDLNKARRAAAVAAGAVETDKYTTVRCIRLHRAERTRKATEADARAEHAAIQDGRAAEWKP